MYWQTFSPSLWKYLSHSLNGVIWRRDSLNFNEVQSIKFFLWWLVLLWNFCLLQGHQDTLLALPIHICLIYLFNFYLCCELSESRLIFPHTSIQLTQHHFIEKVISLCPVLLITYRNSPLPFYFYSVVTVAV